MMTATGQTFHAGNALAIDVIAKSRNSFYSMVSWTPANSTTTDNLQERLRSYFGNFYPASASDQTQFLGVDWKDLSKELVQLGMLRSVPKMLNVCYDILVRITKVIQSPLSIDYLMPGTINMTYIQTVKFKEIEQELIKRQARFHEAKIKCLIASQNLPLTFKTFREVFQKAYTPLNPEYRMLCEYSFQEIYIPYLQDQKYRLVLFVSSYFDRIGEFIPFLKSYLTNSEKILKEREERGEFTTRFAHLDFSKLSALEAIDLIKEDLGTPHTLAIARQTLQYEENLHSYKQLEFDDEEKLSKYCHYIALQVSSAAHKIIWNNRVQISSKED